MRVSLLLACFAAASAVAQPGPSVKPAPTGVVSGHVFFADTNGPARLANVVLEPAAAIDGYKPDAEQGISAHLSGVQTLSDGSFLIPRVAPGTYYVYAWAPGYVSAVSTLGATSDQLLKPDAAVKEAIARTLPRVTVQANLPASVDITLQRGAAVSGTVLYDDGSPAAGLEVRLLVRQKEKWVEPRFSPLDFFTSSPKTDDKGFFRIAGLPEREYLVAVQLSLTRTGYDISSGGGLGVFNDGGSSKLVIYSGDQFRAKDAHPLKLKLGEERPGEDITIPLARLHTVAGAVTAARDGHTLNGGTVALLYADDRTEAATTQLAHGDTGWSLPFVPEGDYLVRVTEGVDAEYDELSNPPGTTPPTHTETRITHRYGTGEQPLHVSGEVSGLAIAVPEPGNKAQGAE